MKVKELVQILEKLDQDLVIRVVVPIEGRPYGGGLLKEVSKVSEIFDQDSNKPSYTIQISEFNE